MYPSTRKEAKEKGEKYYFTGNSCPKGHIATRFASTCNCTVCQHEAIMENQHKYKLKSNYNLTPAQYDFLLEKQSGVCAICQEVETVIDGKTKTLRILSVDHCHETNRIRGLLCSSCNLAIGKFNHRSDLLRKAAIYCEEE